LASGTTLLFFTYTSESALDFNSSFRAAPQARFISDKIGTGMRKLNEEVLIFQIRKTINCLINSTRLFINKSMSILI
jgi:hypothetical protein